MITTTLVYNHRQRFGKDDTAPVEVRVTIARKSYYINTGVKVRSKEWKFNQIVNRGDADTLNDRLRVMLERVDRQVNECLKKGTKIDAAEIRKRVWAPDGRRTVETAEDMLAWMEAEVKHLHVAKGTRAHYFVTLSALMESGIMRSWSDLTLDNIRRWDDYLHTIKKHQTESEINAGKPIEYIKQCTVRNYHKDVKALLVRALKVGLIATNPYDRMKGEIKREDKETVEFLTDAERERIENLTMTEGSTINTVRDIFIFQCYTGMAYSDAMVFSLDKCQKDGNTYTYSAPRIKTGVVFYISLLPKALEIAKKYGGKLPRVADQTCNANLKTIAAVAGITKKVTTHVGRHTFATWMLRNGVPMERVQKMLGHRRITQTQRYAKVLAEDVYGEFARVVKKEKKKRQ